MGKGKGNIAVNNKTFKLKEVETIEDEMWGARWFSTSSAQVYVVMVISIVPISMHNSEPFLNLCCFM